MLNKYENKAGTDEEVDARATPEQQSIVIHNSFLKAESSIILASTGSSNAAKNRFFNGPRS